MKNKNLKDTLSKLLPIVLIICGITLFGMGVNLLAAQAGYQKTTAVISEITEETYTVYGRKKTMRSAVATYDAAGTVYSVDLGGVRKGFAEGGEIELLVDGQAPQRAILPQTVPGSICTAVGAALLLGGLIWFAPLLYSVLVAGKKRNEPIRLDEDTEQ